jgi:hypothetical protein
MEQLCVLLASILADGEITKIYKNSRRKNNSYREHFGVSQTEYRQWKQNWLRDWLYFTNKGDLLVSKSHPLFTELYPYFYNPVGVKYIPFDLLELCKSELFLAVLYMDDGSICITKRIYDRKKLIYLTPHIYLYLQAYSKSSLLLLQKFIKEKFNINLQISNRKDGSGCILKTTSVRETFDFLNKINRYTHTCPSMYYKTNWMYRLKKENAVIRAEYPGYEILTTSEERQKNYSIEEIEAIISMKKCGHTLKEISESLNRTYWSVVYKISELKKGSFL